MKRKICIISGTRADYGILKPVMKACESSKKLELKIIATGMHLQKEYGSTYKEIEKDGFTPIKIDIAFSGNYGIQMAKTVGWAIIKFSEVLAKIKPDIVVVLGDRGEMLAGAIAANYLHIPVAHIHGGEVSGHVDDTIRHAITKLSHLHFTATAEAGQRIIKMGEEPWRVFHFGAPGLDTILSGNISSAKYLAKKYNIDTNNKLILLIQHPVLSEADTAGSQIKVTIDTLLKFKDCQMQIIIIYPNSDAGSQEIIGEIEKYRDNKNIQIYQSLPHNDYLGLLKIADALVGNSSSGIIEAASFKLPVINIGSRQQDRECGKNVIHVGYNKDEIGNALNKILGKDKQFILNLKNLTNPYGNGHASEKIARTLEVVDLHKIINKRMAY